MRILFLARHFTYYRNFEGAIRDLARRGHQVHLAVDREDGRAIAERLAAEWTGVTCGMTPEVAPTRERRLVEALRLGLDFLRYQDPLYDEAPRIRQRASTRTPRAARWLGRRLGRARAARWLGALEAAVPAPAAIERFVRDLRPDVVLLTPLIELGSPQLDYLRAAKQLGIRTALSVWSWDHLSSKALIRVRPDRVLVWNETQRREAIELHGVPAGEVIVTGAQCFDQWFDRAPSLDREAFCRRAGLGGTRPFLLYVCSALFKGSPPEAAFVRRWIQAVRASRDPVLATAPILVRPHPQRMQEWDGADLARESTDVAFFGSNPIDPASRDDYFDSLFHAAAVVGLNTSALIEAAIVDRPVYTVLLPEFHDNQEGTFHFRYLLKVGDGFLHAARSLEAHVAQLAGGLNGRTSTDNRAFVGAFIRPAGLDRPATPAYVAAVEGVAALPSRAPVAPAAGGAWAVLARLAAWSVDRPWGRFWLGDPRWAHEARAKAASEADRRRRSEAEQRAKRDERVRRRRAKAVAAVKTVILRAGLAPRPRH